MINGVARRLPELWNQPASHRVGNIQQGEHHVSSTHPVASGRTIHPRADYLVFFLLKGEHSEEYPVLEVALLTSEPVT
jgi:hypothetical protein